MNCETCGTLIVDEPCDHLVRGMFDSLIRSWLVCRRSTDLRAVGWRADFERLFRLHAKMSVGAYLLKWWNAGFDLGDALKMRIGRQAWEAEIFPAQDSLTESGWEAGAQKRSVDRNWSTAKANVKGMRRAA